MKDRNYILFDLDGTLSDSGEGIINSVKHTLAHFGLAAEPQVLRSFIGPSLAYSFKLHFGFSDEQIAEAIRVYRAFFEKHGIQQNHLYPGIWELLTELAKSGKKMAIATNKADHYAHQTVKLLKLDEFFPPELVIGAPPGEMHGNKQQAIATLLERLGGTAQEAVMVGDRKFDIAAAKANGLDSIGVTYGFGEKEELEAEHPTAIANSVQELRRLLLG